MRWLTGKGTYHKTWWPEFNLWNPERRKENSLRFSYDLYMCTLAPDWAHTYPINRQIHAILNINELSYNLVFPNNIFWGYCSMSKSTFLCFLRHTYTHKDVGISDFTQDCIKLTWAGEVARKAYKCWVSLWKYLPPKTVPICLALK